jgi:putative oxidoreductase
MKTLFTLCASIYRQLIAKGGYVQSTILLIIRLAWGWQLLESGHAHLADVEGTAKNFAEWGIPMPTLNVYLAGSTEMIGGALLMLGLATRLISVPLLFNFCVAYLTASRETVKHLLSQNPDALINDAAFPFLITSILMIAFGPGKVSLDCLIGGLCGRWLSGSTGGSPVAPARSDGQAACATV